VRGKTKKMAARILATSKARLEKDLEFLAGKTPNASFSAAFSQKHWRFPAKFLRNAAVIPTRTHIFSSATESARCTKDAVIFRSGA
jgi:hypothetical protein